jgi:hypothetical protein
MGEIDFGTRVHLHGTPGTVSHFADYYRTQAWVRFDSGSVELVPVEDLRVVVSD